MKRHKSQGDRILELLKSRPEVSALELAGVSLQYSARVVELRRAGHKISNRVETVNGSKRGYFRLERPKALTPQPSPSKDGDGHALFSAEQLSGCATEWRDDG